MRYKIEKNVEIPKRGPRKKLGRIPFEEMEVGDSIRIAECGLSRRPSVYNSVREAIKNAEKSGIKGSFIASTKAIDQNSCEVRLFRIK